MNSFSLSNFDLRHLRVFISVVENEGVSAAALANGVALSTISRDLTSLEERLGVKLCNRGRGGFSLTRQGEAIYRAAVDLQKRIQVFELEVQAAKDVVSDSFNIGINDHLIANSDSGLVAAMAQMRKKFPDTLINVSVHETTTLDVSIRERRLDVGVTGQPAWLQPLQYTKLFLEEHRLYVGTNCPLLDEVRRSLGKAPTEIKNPLPYIARSEQTDGFRGFEDRYPTSVVSRCANLEAVLAAVLSGAGCALMPVKFVESVHRDDVVELPVKEAPFFVQFYLAYRRDAVKQKGLKTFLSQFAKTGKGLIYDSGT